MALTEAIGQRRDALLKHREGLAARYWRNEPIETLVAELTQGMDDLVSEIWREQLEGAKDIALFAVGGYGRGELHPASDIDLLVVAKKPQAYKRQIELFLQGVFDLNVEVGHSVRDLKACRRESQNDITVATAMFERRFITGDERVAVQLDKVMSHSRLWPVDKFFAAKHDEQVQRHNHYDNTEYKLEPNIKTSPGGMRDIHTTLWICRRQFGTDDPDELAKLGVMTEAERRWLVEGRRFLWWVRYGLHLIAGRKEDQLGFAYQRELAQRLGFVDTDAKSGVERFMHHYYRHVLELAEVNDILIQYFQEVIMAPRRERRERVNERFQLVNNYIEVARDEVFRDSPSALLELFVIMANRSDIAGVRASTIRLVRDHLNLIDDDFRNNQEHAELFMELLKAPYTIVSQLTRMRRYGILGRYIPEYGEVIGQMQHDLFHIYTVDAHTMMVIRNMRRFRYRSAEREFPVAYHCAHSIPKVELLYIAGLYHDIGKGRGGDHSELGAVDARAFCNRHGLSEADTDLVCWLVEKHLYMSTVSQREDIYDPDVVHKFASEMKSEMRLDYLYALTVADINATNPTLWNSWRATLLRQLYGEARRTLRRGLESPIDRAETVAAGQERALERLVNDGEDPELVKTLWANLGDDFFLRHTPPQIAGICEDLLAHDLTHGPYVAIRDKQAQLPGEGATHVYVYTPDQPKLFASTVGALAQLGLSVVDATVNTGPNGICFDTYTVLDQEGTPLAKDADLRERIVERLRRTIADPSLSTRAPEKLIRRQLRELPWPTQVTVRSDPNAGESTITVLACDRPGLLATIAELFVKLDLQLLSARITTLGERVEDTFVVQTLDRAAIASGESAYTIENSIRQGIDRALGVS
jgi:[protein-PII] uridylyltransferase